MKDLNAPSQEVRPRVPTNVVSFDGASLIWLNAILFVPAIFGVMFLPALFRTLALSVMIGLVVTYFVLYSWVRTHRDTQVAHVFDVLHLSPPRTTRV